MKTWKRFNAILLWNLSCLCLVMLYSYSSFSIVVRLKSGGIYIAESHISIEGKTSDSRMHYLD